MVSAKLEEKHTRTHTRLVNSVGEFTNRCIDQSDCLKRGAVPTVQMALAGTQYHPETRLFLTADLTSHLTPPSHGTNKRDALNQWSIHFKHYNIPSDFSFKK